MVRIYEDGVAAVLCGFRLFFVRGGVVLCGWCWVVFYVWVWGSAFIQSLGAMVAWFGLLGVPCRPFIGVTPVLFILFILSRFRYRI